VSDGKIDVIPDFSPPDSITLGSWQRVTVTPNAFGPISHFDINRFEIIPDTARIFEEDMMVFTTVGYDEEGFSIQVPVAWECEGGIFDNETCVFTAGAVPGEYVVTATDTVYGLQATAIVIVKGKPVGVPQLPGRPASLVLEQNFPNPFSYGTTIQYILPKSGHSLLSIFNVIGERVAVLVDEEQTVGEYSVQLNAEDFDNGVYFYKLESGDSFAIRKMLVIR
jgi:hypothetical protein